MTLRGKGLRRLFAAVKEVLLVIGHLSLDEKLLVLQGVREHLRDMKDRVEKRARRARRDR